MHEGQFSREDGELDADADREASPIDAEIGRDQ
jgi:hypothetical protein